MKDYSNSYSSEKLFDKITKYAKMAGVELIEKVLILYYTLIDPDTPAWAKAVIISALGYFIFPMDLIPDVIPGAGYTDDLGVLISALSTVIAHIKEEHKNLAKERIKKWFN